MQVNKKKQSWKQLNCDVYKLWELCLHSWNHKNTIRQHCFGSRPEKAKVSKQATLSMSVLSLAGWFVHLCPGPRYCETESSMQMRLTVNWMKQATLQLVLPRGSDGQVWERCGGTHKYKITRVQAWVTNKTDFQPACSTQSGQTECSNIHVFVPALPSGPPCMGGNPRREGKLSPPQCGGFWGLAWVSAKQPLGLMTLGGS